MENKAIVDCAYHDGKQYEITFDADWISVKDRLPPEHESIFAKNKGTLRWTNAMFESMSDDVRVVVRFEDGTRMVSHDYTVDGKWHCEKDECLYPKRTVTHWMENPPLPDDE